MKFLLVTALGSDRQVAINIEAIGYLAETATGHTVIYISGGEGGEVMSGDNFETIMSRLREAEENY